MCGEKQTLTIQFPPRIEVEPVHFWAIDEGTFYAPHAIVVAPPFCIIDVTVKHQPYADDVPKETLPDIVLTDAFTRCTWEPEDLANSEILAALRAHGISFKSFLEGDRPHMLDVIDALPPRSITYGAAMLKYVVVALGGIKGPLEQMHRN